MSDFIFGTSGWSYKEWVGPFYEKPKNMFSYYARFFGTSEINSTFYRYPSESMIRGLERISPPDFVFSAKLPRLITHEKRLNPNYNVKNDLIRFLELLEPLDSRNKLGCILIQLPPSFEYERDRLNFEKFLDMIPGSYEFAAEFRNTSWLREETWTLLKKFGVAYCIVDEPLLPPEVHLTSNFAYFRWHGRNPRPWYDYHYSIEELEKWLPRIREAQQKVEKVYGYFNNHFHGYAIENCIEIIQMLEEARPNHEKIKTQIIRHNLQKRSMTYEPKLDDFGIKLSEEDLNVLLCKLTDANRVRRGAEISDQDVKIEESSELLTIARVKNYLIEINKEERTLQHDCDDWRKGIEVRRICKHVTKLLLSLPAERSIAIMRDMIENKNNWSFRDHDSED